VAPRAGAKEEVEPRVHGEHDPNQPDPAQAGPAPSDHAPADLAATAADLPGSERAPAVASTADAELTALARAAGAGDRAALDQLLRRCSPLLVRYCRARLGGRRVGLQSAEDVAQDVAFALCQALPRFREIDTPFMAFVYGIARNKVVDAFRSAGRDRSEPTDQVPERVDAEGGPEQQVLGSSAFGDLMTLVDRLPEQQREIITLRVIGQLTSEETAQAVGSTPGAVRVAQHRALQKLRRWLEEKASDG
jgi:RNA polymerase sigma-70 factor (ECF subfamily)